MPDTDLLIRNATVVDPRDGTLRVGRDVLVSAGKVLHVLPTEAARQAAQVVDGTGRYIVPGLNDMHAHPLSVQDPAGGLALMLAHGVTGFRQMSGSRTLLTRPALPNDSPTLLGLPGDVLSPANANTSAAVVATVRDQHARGADFIKSGMLTREVFYDAQAEARRLGIPLLGHLPTGIDVERASGQGMRSIEHLGPGVSILACCSSDSEALLLAVRARRELKAPAVLVPLLRLIGDRLVKKLVINPVNMSRQPDIDALAQATNTFDEDAAAKLAQRFVQDHTWQVPTLIRSRTTMRASDPENAADPNLRYINPASLKGWHKATKKFAAFPEESRSVFASTNATMRKLAKLLDDSGVPMLTGSDSGGAAWVVPGAALHQEFDELAASGFTALRVLQMTTSDAARFLGAEGRMGSVEEGKNADLVVLDANPLEAVANLHAIAGVVRAGRYYSSDALDAIKNEVAAKRSAF